MLLNNLRIKQLRKITNKFHVSFNGALSENRTGYPPNTKRQRHPHHSTVLWRTAYNTAGDDPSHATRAIGWYPVWCKMQWKWLRPRMV